MIVIKLRSGAARNQLAALTENIEHPRQVLAAGQIAGRKFLQRHFTEKDKSGNKLGGRRTHFWGEVRESTQPGELTNKSADIDIGDFRFAQRLHGGTIRAKTPWPGSGFLLLTIPVHPAAHGRRASVLKRELGIKLVFLGGAQGGVLGTFAKQAAEDQVYYACVPSVDQAADPDALPAGDILEREAIQGAEDYLRTEVLAAQTGAST